MAQKLSDLSDELKAAYLRGAEAGDPEAIAELQRLAKAEEEFRATNSSREKYPFLSAVNDLGYGIRSGLPFYDQVVGAIESSVTGKPYSEIAKEQEAAKEDSWQNNPYMYATGKLTGGFLGAKGLDKLVPALKLASTTDLVGKAKNIARAKNAARLFGQGAIFGVGTQAPDDIQPLDKSVVKAMIGGTANTVLTPIIGKGTEYAMRPARRLFYGTPSTVTKEAIRNSDEVFKGDAIETGRKFGEIFVKHMETSKGNVGKIIGDTLQEATDKGVQIPMKEVVGLVDDQIAKLNKLDPNLNPDVEAQIAMLNQLKTDYLTPKVKHRIRMQPESDMTGIETQQITDPGELQVSQWTQDVADPMDMVTYTERQGINSNNGPRVYNAPMETNVNMPETPIEWIPDNPRPYETVSPNFAQNIKTRLAQKYADFDSTQKEWANKLVGAIGSEERKAVPKLGALVPDEKIVSIPDLEGGGFDLWSNLQGENKNIANKLFGTSKIPQNLSDKQIEKAIVEIVEDSDGTVQKTLERVLTPEQFQELKKLATTAFAQHEFQGKNALRPYLKNKSIYMGIRSILGAIGIGGAAGAGFIAGSGIGSTGVLGALLGGMAATSNKGVRAGSYINKLGRATALKSGFPQTATQILINKNVGEDKNK